MLKANEHLTYRTIISSRFSGIFFKFLLCMYLNIKINMLFYFLIVKSSSRFICKPSSSSSSSSSSRSDTLKFPDSFLPSKLTIHSSLRSLLTASRVQTLLIYISPHWSANPGMSMFAYNVTLDCIIILWFNA